MTRRFNEAFARRDVDAIMALMTDDAVFESTEPPDGRRHEGQRAIRAEWERLFAAAPGASFRFADGILTGDRAVYRWRYDWGDGHVSGVDLLRVRDGKIAEKLSFVKG